MKKRTAIGCIVAVAGTVVLFLPTVEHIDWRMLGVLYGFAALMIDPSDLSDLVSSWRDSNGSDR